MEAVKVVTHERVGCMMKKYNEIRNYCSQRFGEIRLCARLLSVMRRSDRRKNDVRQLLMAPVSK